MIYKKEYYKSAEHFTCDTTPKRVVEHYELEIYDFGSGCASINDVLYPHNNNMIVFAKPHQERFTIGTFSCYAIHFSCDDETVQKVLNTIPDCTIVDTIVKKQLINLFEEAGEETIESILAIINMLNIIQNTDCYMPDESTPHYRRIMLVKDYIDNNYQNSFDICDFEKMVNLSTNYIRKLFLDTYGMTIHKYITSLRLSNVQKLLASTDLSLCDIAFKSGFNSQSHMNYIFKMAFGVSPLKYKRQKRTM